MNAHRFFIQNKSIALYKIRDSERVNELIKRRWRNLFYLSAPCSCELGVDVLITCDIR